MEWVKAECGDAGVFRGLWAWSVEDAARPLPQVGRTGGTGFISEDASCHGLCSGGEWQ